MNKEREKLRMLINQSLSLAAAEIFELFERTIAEYEEQLCPSKEEKHTQHWKQHMTQEEDSGNNKPEDEFNQTDFQQLLVHKEEEDEEVPPEQQVKSPSLVPEDPTEPQHVKEEHDEVWSSQEEKEEEEEEKEEEIRALTFTPVPVKSEADVTEKLQFSNPTEKNRDSEDCGEPEPDRNLNPDSCLQPETHVEASLSSQQQSDTDCLSWCLDPSRKPQTTFSSNQNVPAGDFRCKSEASHVCSSESSPTFSLEKQTQKHKVKEAGEKPFVCSVCGQSYRQKHSLTVHMRLHSEGKHINCPVCKKSFLWQAEIQRHMRTHTGEKPFSCHFCGLSFSVSSNLKSHLHIHTGEKPFVCSVCKMPFRRREALDRHTKTHTGEKPYSCSICGKRFIQHVTLKRHLMVHTGEKPYGCSACDKRFSRLEYVKSHKCVGESSRNLSS